MGILRFHNQLYKNSKEHHHAGLPETKFGAKYLKLCATRYAQYQARTTSLSLLYPEHLVTISISYRCTIHSLCYNLSSSFTYHLDLSNFILESGLSYFRVLTICLLLVYFVSAVGKS